MNGLILSATLFVPHAFHTLDIFDRERLSEQEYAKYVNWYKALDDAEFLSISYLSDGLAVKGIIGRPKQTSQQRHPVIIYCRGGSDECGKITVETLSKLYFWIKKGYVIIASQYRGNDGGQGKDELGGADIADVRNLIPVINELDYVDARSLHLLGHSRGGMMALMMLREQLPIKSATIIAPVTDYFAFEKLRPDLDSLLAAMIPGMPDNKQQEYFKRSAVCWANEINVPLLIMHGDADTCSNVSQSISLADQLKKHHKEYKLIIYPGDDHYLALHVDDANQQALEWFRNH